MNRILLTNEISNIVVFLNLKSLDDKSINSSFYLFNDENDLSHLILISTKFIKKGDIININEEEIKNQ